jgi:hypothetical protein
LTDIQGSISLFFEDFLEKSSEYVKIGLWYKTWHKVKYVMHANTEVAAAVYYSAFLLKDMTIFYFRSLIFQPQCPLISNTYDIFLFQALLFSVLAVPN